MSGWGTEIASLFDRGNLGELRNCSTGSYRVTLLAPTSRLSRRCGNRQEPVYVIRVQQLRHEAELLRRVASIPTSGDRVVDCELLGLADQLQEKADAREKYLRQSEAAKRSPSTDGHGPRRRHAKGGR